MHERARDARQVPASPAAPAPARLSGIRALQRSVGNRVLQRIVAGDAVAPEVEEAIERERGSGRPLDTAARTQAETAFGADLGSVRVHTGARADTLSRALDATAFTTGSDVFFRSGAYDPGSRSGMQLLGHELAHVVQQSGAAAGGPLTVGADDDEHEHEARAAGAAVADDRTSA